MESPHLRLLLALLAAVAPSSATPEVIRLPSTGRARACAAPADPAAYDRPVIGIVTHPGDGTYEMRTHGAAAGASYVKFVEAGGARVIPLVYNEPEERLLKKLSLVNGVLFTGGSQKNGSYFETIKKVFQYVLDRNDAGDPLPLLAECLGFELVSMIVSKSFDALNQPSTLRFPNYSSLEGSVFQRFDPDLIKKVSTSCLVMQNHRYGISPKRLQKNDALSSFFKILTTSPDENGKVYVSTVQAHKYPIICTQWHPEKAIFEWGEPSTPHSEDAVKVTQHPSYADTRVQNFLPSQTPRIRVRFRHPCRISSVICHVPEKFAESDTRIRVRHRHPHPCPCNTAQHFADYFVSQARRSQNRPREDKVLDSLIHNYSPRFGTSKSFDEVYVFT